MCDWLGERGGSLSAADLAGYGAIERAPVRVAYRDREILTNPPPSAGGTLLAYALALLDRGPAPPTLRGRASTRWPRRSPSARRSSSKGSARRASSSASSRSRLGSTTHISVIDGDGRACSVDVHERRGLRRRVPGTGIHINNVMGEEDLNPLGFHRHPARRRMPSMMAPSIVMRDGEVELVLGSAGSNRIRSALLQTIVGVVDHRTAGAREAVSAPRVHFEDGVVFAEPGIELARALDADARSCASRAPNLFFGGVQARSSAAVCSAAPATPAAAASR